MAPSGHEPVPGIGYGPTRGCRGRGRSAGLVRRGSLGPDRRIHLTCEPMDLIERAMYNAICAEPGLHPREYVQRVQVNYQAATNAARRLLALGVVRRTGQTRNIRYWPAESN